jgi:hypothetical protein
MIGFERFKEAGVLPLIRPTPDLEHQGRYLSPFRLWSLVSTKVDVGFGKISQISPNFISPVLRYDKSGSSHIAAQFPGLLGNTADILKRASEPSIDF